MMMMIDDDDAKKALFECRPGQAAVWPASHDNRWVFKSAPVASSETNVSDVHAHQRQLAIYSM